MKSSLSHLPLKKQRELERILALIFEEFEEAFKLSTQARKKSGRILKVILFGSYARGALSTLGVIFHVGAFVLLRVTPGLDPGIS